MLVGVGVPVLKEGTLAGEGVGVGVLVLTVWVGKQSPRLAHHRALARL